MAGGADIPYQLRPNKFIDRQLFLDLLSRVVSTEPDGTYLYVSMGGKHLVDQESVYRRIGIRKLFSFDGDPAVVSRMACNRPLPGAVCVEMMSGELAGQMETLLADFEPACNFVVWLDYTKAEERFSQLQEFAATLKKAGPGDVFRITMNADDSTLDEDWIGAHADGPGQHRAAMLREQIGDYHPARVQNIAEGKLPWVLAQAVALSVAEAEGESDVTFRPLLLTTYADRQRMFTAVVIAQGPDASTPAGLRDWDFLSADWQDVVEILAPDLSIREKLTIDQHLESDPEDIIAAIGFQPATDPVYAVASLASYRQLHRFYPTFYAIGIQ